MAKTEFRYISGPAIDVQKTLNQWASTGYALVLHGLRCHAEIEQPAGRKTDLISVLVERSK